jgi:hypothetical protein
MVAADTQAKTIKNRASKAFTPRYRYYRCSHFELLDDNTKGPRCKHRGVACYLSSYGSKPYQYVCYAHRSDEGYCSSCGEFCAGLESFDFGRHAGYCDNCADQLEDFDDEYMADDDYMDSQNWDCA